MYAGLSAEATTVVDGVFADEYGTISGTSHSDMGLMAETTYYYRVSAINSVGKGEYSDGMAMAMTMAENMAPMAGAWPLLTRWSMSAPWSRCRATSLTPTKTCCPTRPIL